MTKNRLCFWKLAVILTILLLTFMGTAACSSKIPDQTASDTSTSAVKSDTAADITTDVVKSDTTTDTANPETSTETSTGTSSDSENTTSSSLPDSDMLRSNSDGEVTIDVKYLGYKDNLLSFDIAMDTHSVDLDQYDLAKLSELTDDKGNKYPVVSWDSAPGGHHRTGKLTFSQPDTQDKPGTLILIIRNVAGIAERMFKWENLTSNS
ncbi:MAG: hypothetical protein M1308_06915 [Actinobacteria bacterium]|nr:hypothetical protein [Actinomycetota bacterium]